MLYFCIKIWFNILIETLKTIYTLRNGKLWCFKYCSNWWWNTSLFRNLFLGCTLSIFPRALDLCRRIHSICRRIHSICRRIHSICSRIHSIFITNKKRATYQIIKLLLNVFVTFSNYFMEMCTVQWSQNFFSIPFIFSTLQPNGVNLWYLKLWQFDKTQFIVGNIKGIQLQVKF